jgi:DNA polymerase/3'-5' exonuclease PolX
MDNRAIARQLLAHADRLDLVDPNIYRRRAYRRAAQTVLAELRPVADLWHENGRAGLQTLVGIGDGLARSIEALLRDGEIPLSRPVTETDAKTVRMTVKGSMLHHAT